MLLCLDGILRLWLVASSDQVLYVIRCLTALLLSCFRARQQQRTPPALERSKFHCSWSPILHTQGQEAIYIRLHLNNINGDSGIEIFDAWMPKIKKHNSRRAVRSGSTNHSRGIPSNYSWEKQHIGDPYLSHSAKKISSLQLKRLDRLLKWPDRKTNDEKIYWQQK